MQQFLSFLLQYINFYVEISFSIKVGIIKIRVIIDKYKGLYLINYKEEINNRDTNNLGKMGSTTTDKNHTTNPNATINVKGALSCSF